MTRESASLVIFAYACEPGRGSEPGAGWGVVEAVATFADCTVLVAPEHMPGINRQRAGDSRRRCEFVEVAEPQWAGYAKWHRITRFLAYVGWLRRAFRKARELHAQRPFDAAHHATYAVYWLPSPVVDLGIPSVWGPVGGAVTTPLRLWPLLGPAGILGEVLDLVAVRLASWLPWTRRTWRWATVRISQNERTAGRIAAAGCDSVVLNHAMFTRVPPAPSRDSGTYVLWASALEARKGPRLAVRALACTPPEVRLIVLGDGPERGPVERLALRLGVADRLELRGKVPRDEAIGLMRGAAAAVFTGLREEGGLALAEAMLLGTPVAVLGIGGARTLAEAATDPSRVVIVEPGSIEDTARRLADAIVRLRSVGRGAEPLLDQDGATARLQQVFCSALESNVPN